jgi:hypothetical protein
MQAINATVRNEDLATVALSGADLAAVRADYEAPWNRANALRTGLSIAGFAFLVAAVASDRPDRSRTDTAAAAVPANL